jgi:hypothetical protein
MAVSLPAPRTGRTLLPRNIFFNVSGTHFFYKLSKHQDLVRPEGLGKFKITPYRVSNSRLSGLYSSALASKLPRAPILIIKNIFF